MDATGDAETLSSTLKSNTPPICPHCRTSLEENPSSCPKCGEPLDDDDDVSLVGTVVAEKFALESILGEGAMGRVYRARQLTLDKPVAVKILHHRLSGDRNTVRRFHREARAASRLNHPNSLHIIDFGQNDGILYIAMELVEGRDLYELLKDDFPLSLERVVDLMGQVCLALDEAHAAGIVHRDLKPENIMVVRRRDGQEQVKVCDFGIAKIQDPGDMDTSAPITLAGIVCGTPEYMSPEQCRGEELDGRTDLYSAGVILYQLTTKALPFVADSPLGVVTRQLTDDPVRPTLIRDDLEATRALEPIIMRALLKDRDERFHSARDLKAALERILTGEPPTPSSQISAPTSRSSRWPMVLGASIGAAAAAFLAVWLLVPIASSPSGADADDGAPTQLGTIASTHPQEASSGQPSAPQRAPDAAQSPAVDAGAADALEVIDAEAPAPPSTIATAPPRSAGPSRRPRTKTAEPAPEPRPDPPPPQKSTYQRGIEAFHAGHHQEAIRHFEAARRASPGRAEIHRMLGKCYYRVQRLSQARAAYRRYLQLRPNAPDRQFIEPLLGD